jgi:aryl-alcohol dehydrogenase-like predicted oxidoreductase
MAVPRDQTGALGFGCARLLAKASAREGERLLEAAFGCGISHFDVARSYGDGRAEQILGRVAQRHPGRVRIFTKAGIDPPSGIERIARKLTTPFGRGRTLAQHRPSRFHPNQVAMSVLKSLKALRTPEVDAVLLHDCTLQDLSEELLHLLQTLSRRGVIGAFGVATSAQSAALICQKAPAFCSIVQIPDDGVTPLPVVQGHLITHSFWRGQEENYENQLISALRRNSRGTVLFSSHNQEHIRRNSQLASWDDSTLDLLHRE